MNCTYFICKGEDITRAQLCYSVCKDTLYSETGPKSQFRVGCSTPNVGYRVVCLNCQKLGLKAAYEGETGKPVKVRFKRHLET